MKISIDECMSYPLYTDSNLTTLRLVNLLRAKGTGSVGNLSWNGVSVANIQRESPGFLLIENWNERF